ncbi:MAG: SecD/SecF fusion protein [Chthoniobacter sp.]|jgi:SecD/SecF fusion protein|nr:SecD/SecF fusion protein [Chthoniobacter sp.]
MNPFWTFSAGLFLLILFGWYFATDLGRRKRMLGTALTVFLVAFCLIAVNPPREKIHLGLDLQGGTSFLLRLVREGGQAINKGMVEQAVEVIRKRVDQFGVSEPVITPQGEDRILVQIPGLDAAKIEEARTTLQKVAKLELKLVHAQSDSLISQIEAGTHFEPSYEVKSYKDTKNGKPVEEKLLVGKKAVVTGDHVSEAHAYYDNRGYGISFKLDSVGAEQFGKTTEAHVGERLAIMLDGEVQSAPNIQTAIYGGSAVITGRFSETEARNLASVLENPLQTPVVIEETRSASSTLGTDSIRSGVYAGIGGLVLVLIFVAVYYQFAGLVAILGLVVNIILLFGAMSMFNFVLTLPGIAGIILTIGLAVDANVLIYERLREEMAAGKSLGAAIDAAYEKAFSVIFDANATTLITAAILFWKASGPIRGFAVTLVVGIIASVFTAMIFTRTVFAWALAAGWLKRVSMLHLISGKNFDFLGKRFLWIGISLTVIGISIASFVLRGEHNFGIDFKGGDLLMLESKQPVAEADVRAQIAALGIKDEVVQREHEPALNKDYISIRSAYGTADQIEAHLQKTMPQAGFSEHKKDQVGSLVGHELARTSLWALALAIIGILFYVTLRFEFSFAIGAIVALLHDIIITVGLFAIFGRELSLIMVGAILTIAGYSINDTIVVYDRIREGLRSGRKGTIQQIMNASINETLSRTLLTSGCTFLSVAALFFFGGPVLHDFAFAILIGVIVGTYSSIFIASPIVLWWGGHKGRSLTQEVKRAQTATA